ncbi:MAG: hypothetical protein ACYSW8_11320, partial [Planctomycetota bacterium]
CLWDPKRGNVVLNDQVPRKLGSLTDVIDINNRGCILATVRRQNSRGYIDVLLEPIPERWDK